MVCSSFIPLNLYIKFLTTLHSRGRKDGTATTPAHAQPMPFSGRVERRKTKSPPLSNRCVVILNESLTKFFLRKSLPALAYHSSSTVHSGFETCSAQHVPEGHLALLGQFNSCSLASPRASRELMPLRKAERACHRKKPSRRS